MGSGRKATGCVCFREERVKDGCSSGGGKRQHQGGDGVRGGDAEGRHLEESVSVDLVL